MKKIILLLTTLCFCGVASAQNGSITFKCKTLEEAYNEAINLQKYIFVYITSKNCTPCVFLETAIFTDEAVAGYVNKNFVTLKADSYDEQSTPVIYKLNPESYPAIIILNAKGKEIDRIIGADNTPEAFLWAIDEILARYEYDAERDEIKSEEKELRGMEQEAKRRYDRENKRK